MQSTAALISTLPTVETGRMFLIGHQPDMPERVLQCRLSGMNGPNSDAPQGEGQPTMETKLEQIAVKAVNQLPKSVVREIHTSTPSRGETAVGRSEPGVWAVPASNSSRLTIRIAAG